MSTRCTSRLVVAALVLCLGALTLVACADDEPSAPPDGPGVAEALQGITRTLDRRAAALRAADEGAFLRTVADEPGLSGEQTTYFDNVSELPVAELSYRVRRETLARDGGAYWAEVTASLRLEGYDDAPVTTEDRWRFTPTSSGAFVLASTTDATWEADRLLHPQPWDVAPVEVRQRLGVLGVFDAGSVTHAGTVLGAVDDARYDVASVLGDVEVPDVVVYVLSDPRLAATVTGPGVGEDLDAATIAVPADPTQPTGAVASYRVVLDLRVVTQSRDVLDRLVRHELTHVALGDRGAGAPLWLTEGVAEYVSVRPMPPSERRLPAAALDLVASEVPSLPPDEVYAGPDAEAWYAVGWWVCEFVAATYGDDMLWLLLDELDDGADPEDVLPAMLGLTPTQLAQRGAGLMRRTYRAG